ncbi:MAG: AI-2E family transporter [Lachnospiraceae bacterium]|nr:AI-2E family transporter [Lachnospiraceae bacterium]
MKLEWKTCIRVGVSVFVLFLAIRYWDVAMGFLGVVLGAAFPLLLGGIIAYVMNILMSLYERCPVWNSNKLAVRQVKRPVCILLAFVTIVVVVYLLINMILPELIAGLQVVLSSIPDAVESAIDWLREHLDEDIWKQVEGVLTKLENMDWQSALQKAASFLMNGVSGAMGSIVSILSSFVSTLISVVLATVFALYLLSGKEKIGGQVLRLMKCYMGEPLESKVMYVIRTFDSSFRGYISGQCTEAVILGTLCTLGLLALQMPYATMVGCLVGFMSLIPIAGSYIGAAVGTFMIFTESPTKALGFLIFLIILLQLEGNLIYPRVVGASIGLPGIWVLSAVTIGGGIMGVPGMLLGVPLAASCYKLLRTDMHQREQQGRRGIFVRGRKKEEH